MGKFIVIVLVVVVGLGIAGFALGWFTFATSPDKQKTGITLSVDREKVKKDRDALVGAFRPSAKEQKKDSATTVGGGKTERDAFLAQSETRFKAMDLNLAELKTKAKAKNGLAVTQEKMDQAIGELTGKTEAARVELQELKTAAPERWDDLKTHFSGAMEALETRFEQTFARFMNEWTRSP